MSGPGDVITRHIEAFNARDQDAEPWAADAQIVAPGASVSGRDEVLGFLSVFQAAFPNGRLEVEQLLAEGPAAAAEGREGRRHPLERCARAASWRWLGPAIGMHIGLSAVHVGCKRLFHA